MEVEYAFVADSANVPPDGKLYVLGGGIDTISARAFPTTHPFMSLVVKLSLHQTECERTHKLEIELWGPDAERLNTRLSTDFSVNRRQDDPTRASFVQLVFNVLQQAFPRPGAYAFHIVVNGQRMKTVPLYLERAAETDGSWEATREEA